MKTLPQNRSLVLDMDAEVATAATWLVMLGGLMSLTVLFVVTVRLLF